MKKLALAINIRRPDPSDTSIWVHSTTRKARIYLPQRNPAGPHAMYVHVSHHESQGKFASVVSIWGAHSVHCTPNKSTEWRPDSERCARKLNVAGPAMCHAECTLYACRASVRTLVNTDIALPALRGTRGRPRVIGTHLGRSDGDRRS